MHQVLQQREDPLLRLEKAASSLLLQGTRLYVGTSDGSLSCFKVSENQQSAELQHSKSDVSGGKSIAQLAFIKELSSLVVLADGNVSLLDAQTFALQSSLQAQCKSQASHFTLHTHVRPASDEQPAAIVSCLVVSAKRRLLLFRWTEAEWQQPGELSLPHQARSITFMTPSTLVLGFSDGSYSKLSIRDFTQLQLAEFPIADMLKSSSSAPVSSSSAGFTSLAFKTGGYIGLGSKVAKNQVLSASKGELFVCKEKHALLLPADGPSQELHFEVEPDHILLTPPFIIASFTSSRRLSVYSATTMELVQDFIPSAALDIVSTAAALRMPVLAASGFNIYLFPMVSYPDQLTSLLSSGHYAAALTLVNAIEDSVLPDRIFRLRTVKSLVALQQLLSGAGDAAIDAFIDLDINPAKIVGLWDARISGKLYLGDAAEETFGGRKKSEVERLEAEEAHNQSEEAVAPENDTSDTASIRSAASSLWRHSSRTPIATSPYRGKHDRQTSTSSLQGGLLQDAAKKEMQTFKDSVEVLLRYLADRRQKVNKALAALPESERPGTADDVPNANSDELLALPDAPLTSLSSAELRKVAQVVDTALFKCYLLVRPTLLGPLCRLDNWCKAEEVEGLLLSAKVSTRASPRYCAAYSYPGL